MEPSDGALTLGAIYHQLMELNSIEKTLSAQIGSIGFQSRRAERAMDAELRQYLPDDWPGDSFQKIVHELEQVRCKVASLHSSMRDVANASSRSRIRSLNILDLPDELLRTIFEHSRDQYIYEDYFYIPDFSPWEGIKNIKNIRLTCRRFCNTSSHLLLSHIDVYMRPSSLAHLQEIACHPLLSKGIKAVRVHLKYFSAGLSTDIFHFAELAYDYVGDMVESYRSDFESDEQEIYGIPREKLGPAIKKAEVVLEDWGDFLNALWHSSRDPDITKEKIAKSRAVAGLASAHGIYRQEYLAQEGVLKGGAFVQAIVAAMSKMPTAKKLFVGDSFSSFREDRRKYWKPFEDVDPESLAAFGLVRPECWDAARSHQLDDQPKEILLQLLTTVFDSDIPIDYLCMELTAASDLSIPATQEQLQQLAVGTEHLRVFDFRGSASYRGRRPMADHGPEQIASFGSFISACMGGKALTRLDVDLAFTLGESAPQPPVSMGSLLVSRHFPYLRDLRLSNFPIHLSELKTLLEGLNKRLSIELDDVLLLSGTWAEALDLIRDKANRESVVTRPSGAECEDMSDEETLAIFGKEFSSSFDNKGEATWYIRRYTDDNPLRNRMDTSAS